MSKVLITISGSPGTGKSTLARCLAKKLGLERLNLHNYHREISKRYDGKKQSYVVDYKKFEKLVREKKKQAAKGLVIDSHISHLLPKELVDACVVLICSDLKILQKRLGQRGYNKRKIRENIDAEIFQVCLNEAREKGHKVVAFDCCKDKNIAEKIIKLLKS